MKANITRHDYPHCARPGAFAALFAIFSRVGGGGFGEPTNTGWTLE